MLRNGNKRPGPHVTSRIALAALAASILAFGSPATADIGLDPNAAPLELNLRTRVETSADSGTYHAVTRPAHWDPRKTAIVVCDMWDKHWCRGATERVAQMAPRMNEVIAAARERGVLIIHCPSGTMDAYEGTPPRRRAQQAAPVDVSRPLESWCHLDTSREAALPIDDSDGGCDCQPECKQHKAWSRQIAAIEIDDGDAVTDSAEAFYLMKKHAITNVIVMGVHANMCVLGRPFSIRQMVYQGQNVVLMHDLTDTMYDSRQPPYVSHFTGNDLVIEHIEKYWCPTITSADFLGGEPFRFAGDKRPHVVMLIGEKEYKTRETLPHFGAKHLGRDFRVSYVFADEENGNDFPGIEVIDEADVLLVSVRRRALPPEQMKAIREFVRAGKPVVGIRTANHALSLRGKEPPDGLVTWEDFDAAVIGGNYTGHHGNDLQSSLRLTEHAGGHPIFQGVDPAGLKAGGSLYKVSPLGEKATPLLTGEIADHPPEPVAWTYIRDDGGRTFYTSLGHPQEFQSPAFNRMLRNAIFWAADIDPRADAEKKTAGTASLTN